MCRLIFLILLMANIMPLCLLEGIHQCYVGQPNDLGNYWQDKCDLSDNDACLTIVCDDGNNARDYHKRCGKCPTTTPKRVRRSIENRNPLNGPRGGGNSFGEPGTGGNGDPFPEYGRDELPPIVPKEGGSGNCKCTDCKGALCNKESPKSKGNINQCYGHQIGKDYKTYKTVNCTIFDNDACRTIDCPFEDVKSCGKCPPPEKLKAVGCKCTECTEGDLCNKPITVNQCYWGDDQKGYEAMECKADGNNNKACKVVKCRGGQNSNMNPLDGSNRVTDSPFAVGKVYRDCGKCSENDMAGPCKCFTCNDNDLCNGTKRVGSTSFLLMLAVLGGESNLHTSIPINFSQFQLASMCRLIFLLLLMANIVPQYLLGDAAKCYKAPHESADPKEIDCPSEGTGVCFLMKCSGADESESQMGCGNCPPVDALPPGCNCTECNEKDLCYQPEGPIKQCYGEGRSTSSAGGFEYEKVKCKFHNNDGCKTIEPVGGAKSAQDLEKSCGKCPEEKHLSKGKVCNHCDSGDSCNDKVVGKCYVTSSESADPTETSCLSDDCFLIQCIGSSGSKSRMGCGTCYDQGHESGCNCNDCKGHLCNQPKDPIKQCYGEGRPTSSGGFEYEKVECKFYNNDGCKTIESLGGAKNARDLEKSCGKCPAEKDLSKGKECNDCVSGDLCNDKVVGKCYEASYKLPDPKVKNCLSDDCFLMQCSGSFESESTMGCGTCSDRGFRNSSNCNCTNCKGHLCNQPEVPIKQCYGSLPTSSDGLEYEKVECKFYNNDGCKTIVRDGGRKAQDYEKSCGKCSEKEPLPSGWKCIECNTEECNKKNKDKGPIKQCYSGKYISGKFEKDDCKFFNNDGCQTKVCKRGRGVEDYKKGCGMCPTPEEERAIGRESDPDCKCSNCTFNLCNEEKDKGTIKQCYGGEEGSYNEEDCKFYNNDGCHTIVCDNKKDKKGCGKCPPSEKLETMGSGCKCEECDGELCNKELTVNQCYFGDDQKGYEPMDCTAPQNTACKKVKCRGAGDYSIDPETGKRGTGFAKNYRECGKCEDMPDTCKCLQCNDKDLCNGGLRIGSPTFVLVMIGGVVALMAMKPLVGIGI